MNRRYIIYSEPYSDFVVQRMKEATEEQKRGLDLQDLKWFRSERTMMDFAHNEPQERLDLLLIKLGYSLDKRIYKDEAEADNLEMLSINQFHFPELRVDVTEQQVARKIHHLSSREVVHAMAMCSRNVHTPVYSLSSAAKYMMKRMKGIRKIKVPYQEQINEAGSAMQDLNRLQLSILNSLGWAYETLGLEQNDIRILSALYDKRHGALTVHEIAQETILDGKIAYLKKNVDTLEGLRLIASDRGIVKVAHAARKKVRNERVYYVITAAGIKVITDYLNHIHEMAFKIKE